MKKYLVVLLLLVFFVTGCDKIKEIIGKERTPEELLDKYADAFLTSDPDKFRDVVPKFFVDYVPEAFTKEEMEKDLKREKGFFGDDMKVVYEIKEKKHITGSDLDELNGQIQSYYKTSEKASDCYYLDGSITLTGSKGSDPDPLLTYYCKYNGTWYLIMG